MSSFDDYEIINHTADIGIKVKASSLNLAFEKIILALTDVLTGEIRTERKERRQFKVKEKNLETALVSILEEILFLFENQNFAATECQVGTQGDEYKINLYGSIHKPEEIKEGTVIKAVTYHNLKINKENSQWIIQVIFDI